MSHELLISSIKRLLERKTRRAGTNKNDTTSRCLAVRGISRKLAVLPLLLIHPGVSDKMMMVAELTSAPGERM